MTKGLIEVNRRYRIKLSKKPQHIPEGYWWIDDENRVCFAEFNPQFKKKKED